jgi:hypothetical protein
VTGLSLGAQSEPRKVIDWLIEQSQTVGSDRWPRERIAIHGDPGGFAIAELEASIARHSQPRVSGPHESARSITSIAAR